MEDYRVPSQSSRLNIFDSKGDIHPFGFLIVKVLALVLTYHFKSAAEYGEMVMWKL